MEQDLKNKGKRIMRTRIMVFAVNVIILVTSVLLIVLKVGGDTEVRLNTMMIWIVFSDVLALVVNVVIFLESKNIGKRIENSSREFMMAERQNKEIISVLSSSFVDVFLVNLKSSTVKFVKLSSFIIKSMQDELSRRQTIDEYLKAYAERFIEKRRQDEFLGVLSVENIARELEYRGMLDYFYVGEREGEKWNYQVRATWYDRENGLAVVGFSALNTDKGIETNPDLSRL